MFDAGLRRDRIVLTRISRFMNDAISDIFSHCDRHLMDGVYDKTYAWLRNPEFPKRLLPPYLGLTDEQSRQCRTIYETNYQHADEWDLDRKVEAP